MKPPKYKYQLQHKINQYWKDDPDCTWNTEKEAKEFIEYCNRVDKTHNRKTVRIIRLKYEDHCVLNF